MKLKLYLGFIKNTIKKNLSYRMNVWSKIFGKLLYFYVQFSVWQAFYFSNGNTYAPRLISYIIASNLITCFVDFDTIELLNQKIRSGDIVMDLLRPFNYITYAFCQGVGTIVVNCIFQLCPLILISVIFLEFKIEVAALFPFIVSLILAMGISFLFSFMIGILAFWIFVTWPINMMVNAVYKILSGAWIPLWLFPHGLWVFTNCFPFQCIYYTPAYILSSSGLTQQETLSLLGVQGLWICLLSGLVTLIWHAGRRKLVVQGG